MDSHKSQEHSAVYEQIHALASHHGSKLVQTALDAARSSQEVQRRDSNLDDLDNLEPERRTAFLRLCSEEDESNLPAISSEILNAVLENQLHSRPLVKVDLDVVRGTISSAEMGEFCMEQVQSLRDYSRLLSNRNPFDGQGQVTGSVFGKLTLTSICPLTVETFLCDIGILSLFDTLCVNLECERSKHVPRNVADRLRNCIAESGIQHLRLSHCSMRTRDLQGLCYTGNFESIRLKNVTAVDPPVTIHSTPRTTQHAVRKVHVSIGIDQNFHQSVKFLPRINTLKVPSGEEESIVQHVHHFRGINEIQVTISTTVIVQASLNRLFSSFGLDRFESLRHFSVVANDVDLVFSNNMSLEEREEYKNSEKIYARRLFQWAVSPNCRWHSISLEIGTPEGVLEALEEVANSDDAQAVVSGIDTSKLRMLKLGSQTVWEDDDPESAAGMTRLLNLLTVHLPYCYYMGNAWRDRGTDEINPMLSQKISLQLERNHVGMALLHPDVFPGIPAGVWPQILANATGSKGGAKIPWTGMYCLIKELVEREVIQSTSSVYQAHGIKRQKTDS